MAVFRSPSPGSAGLPGAAVHAGIDGYAALVLLHPCHGEPRGLVHKIEAQTLAPLPGQHSLYAGWSTLVDGVKTIIGGGRRVAMQYSPNCAVPYVAMVDAGTVELVRGLGVDVVTSANLIQFFESRWTEEQLVMHLEAARKVDGVRRNAFERVGEKLRAGDRVTEWEMQQFILARFKDEGLTTDHGPDVAVNANASNPHYEPKQDACSEIKRGDLVLMDMWAKLDRPDAVYYDITWVGFCGAEPPAKVERVFTVVRDARDLAIARVKDAVNKKKNCRALRWMTRRGSMFARRDSRSSSFTVRGIRSGRKCMGRARIWTIWRRTMSAE